MSEGDFDENSNRKAYTAPYTSKHPIPTVQKYRAHRTELDEQQKQAEQAQHDETDDSKLKRAFKSVKKVIRDDDDVSKPPGEPYPSGNLNNERPPDPPPKDHGQSKADEAPEPPPKNGSSPSQRNGDTSHVQTKSEHKKDDDKSEPTAGEKAVRESDPKEKRKAMKHNKRNDGGREVTE